jgi:hypothetical protein
MTRLSYSYPINDARKSIHSPDRESGLKKFLLHLRIQPSDQDLPILQRLRFRAPGALFATPKNKKPRVAAGFQALKRSGILANSATENCPATYELAI